MSLQQDEVISELLENASSSTGPECSAVLATRYLVTVALNIIFEHTLLGSKTLFLHAQGTGIQRLNDGFQYFWDWAQELVASGEFDNLAWVLSDTVPSCFSNSGANSALVEGVCSDL